MEMLVGSGLSREWVPGIKNYLRIVAESIKKYLVQYNLTPGFKDGIIKKKIIIFTACSSDRAPAVRVTRCFSFWPIADTR